MLQFLIALLERITLVLLTVDMEQFLLLFQRIMTTIKEKKAKAMTDYRITSLHCYTIPALVGELSSIKSSFWNLLVDKLQPL